MTVGDQQLLTSEGDNHLPTLFLPPPGGEYDGTLQDAQRLPFLLLIRTDHLIRSVLLLLLTSHNVYTWKSSQSAL